MILELKQLFGNVFEEDLIQEIAKVGTLKEIPEEFMMIDIGQNIKGIPLMISGAIKISRENENGEELLLYYLEAGDSCTLTFAWEMGETKSKIRAISEMPSKLIMIPIGHIKHWESKYPSWRRFLFRSYQIRMDELIETLDSLAFNRLEKRLVDYMAEKKRVNGKNELFITHQNIAQELHSSRVVISRLLKKLELSGKIQLKRNKIIVL
ncbi:MAG: Crp/Fnr family transcriptional regulator [Bacteroidetes bacterium]|jgi:CRP/FNR family transcriptional regulator|nr:Crp/Fnr family transcriptional regulator [Bacteroidota bacterium]MDA0935838.1 Crp/Fnr family transcriptional regulator [Bacteroidota bacterium]